MRSNFRRLRAEALETRNLLAADVAAIPEVAETTACDVCAEFDQDHQRVSVAYEKERPNADSNVWSGLGESGGFEVNVETTATEPAVVAGQVLKIANFEFRVEFSEDCYVVATLQGHINLKNGRITLNGTVTNSTMSAIAEGSQVHLQSVVSAIGDDPLGHVEGEITFNTQSA